jgi:pyruvate carboxylase
MSRLIRKLLVANRSEIAIRIFRAATELGLKTVAIYAEEDKLSLHRFKADEAYKIGELADGTSLGPIASYLSIEGIIKVAKAHDVDAIHPGYGFLSESPEFAEACAANNIIFIGPSAHSMRLLGNKVAARDLALAAGVPVMPATLPLPLDRQETKRMAQVVGYPLMLKASWGGGGRGMRTVEAEADLIDKVDAARRESLSAFGKDEVYLEKLVQQARHVEVQILGDRHGTLVHLFERDCSIQRRNQKVIERAPAPYLNKKQQAALCEAALKIGRAADYFGAGTVEFLMDVPTGEFYFIEVNPRIQVEHTVTEVVTGLDIVKAQIRIAEGGKIGKRNRAGDWDTGIPSQAEITLHGHALQCRVTTENPEENFVPDYGRITAYRGAMGFGIRIDGGTAYSGAVITRAYDPLLEKVTAWAQTPHEAILRMDRALREYRIRGVATNLAFLENVVSHPKFSANAYTTRFIDDTPELFQFARKRDRATKLLTYIADVTVNGHPEVKGRARPPADIRRPVVPQFVPVFREEGTRQRLDRIGPKAFASWMQAQQRVLVTDTTMRDGHQSLLATRMRSADIVPVARAYSDGLPDLLSLECWGGATFDVAMRFLTEDPWERLAQVREAAPNILTQMLLRGANGVGYTNYPDNVVQHFVRRAAAGGMDLFRIFDCLNWVENMRVAIDAVASQNKLAEGAICYTGDILDEARPKYGLKYYINLGRELEKAGCHILGIKDMAGLLKPEAARLLIRSLKQEIGIPIHLHTHDTSGISAATVLAAVEAGVDAIDGAMDSLSGLTSQPCLGSIVMALKGSVRETGLDPAAIRQISAYWENVRRQYAAFETDMKAGASEVYQHEMPGGQFTNLKQQARSLGLETRWHEVAEAYAQANLLFGDIIKVTPSSKVVGDMALMMVAQGLEPEDVLDPSRDIAFPTSVIEMLRGDLGQPHGGWPVALQVKVLKGEVPQTARPGSLLASVDLGAARSELEKKIGRSVTEDELSSSLMYPKVFHDFAGAVRTYGPVSVLPTPVYFYGMAVGDEISLELERGKSLVVRLQAIGEVTDEGERKVFFELNGQPRIIKVPDRSASSRVVARVKADPTNSSHVAAPMPGLVASVAVKTGQEIAAGDILMTLEAMKMETTIVAERSGKLADVLVKPGLQVDAKDLLIVYA